MASKEFYRTIVKGASFLSTPTAQEAKQYLSGALITALDILDFLADGQDHEYGEIAEATGLNHTTVRAAIKGLYDGGYPIEFSPGELRSKRGRAPTRIRIATLLAEARVLQ